MLCSRDCFFDVYQTSLRQNVNGSPACPTKTIHNLTASIDMCAMICIMQWGGLTVTASHWISEKGRELDSSLWDFKGCVALYNHPQPP